MEQPLPAQTFNEARYYLKVTACGACGQGPWEVDQAEPPAQPGEIVTLRARCIHCGAERTVRFACEQPLPATGPQAECINPTPTPSRIIGLGQWLGMFYYLVEAAARADSRPAGRRIGYRAALCLAEALKFYGQDELPPASAFFSEAAASIFRRHPERFARRKLRGLQAKLPPLAKMARSVNRDERRRRKRWWQFWRWLR